MTEYDMRISDWSSDVCSSDLHDRRHRAEQNRLGHASLFGAGNVMRNLAATSGMADMDGVRQIELGGQFDHVCRIGVHLVAGISLGRAAMADRKSTRLNSSH